MSDEKPLNKAITAIRQGDKRTGQKILLDFIKANPDNEKAWLWLSATTNNPKKKKKCLTRVLQIDPDNKTAKRALSELYAATRSRVESPTDLPERATRASEPRESARKTKQCSYCAETIKAEAIICRFCNRDLNTGELSQTGNTNQPVIVQGAPQRMWSPGVAIVLSLLIPGAGQMYKGQVIKGLLLLAVTAIGYAAFVIPGILLHLLCIFDAGTGNPYKETTASYSQAQTTSSGKGSNASKTIFLIFVGACILFLACFVAYILIMAS